MSNCEFGRVEEQIEIRGGAERFYDVFLNRPHHIPGIISSQNCANLPRVDIHDEDDHYSGGKVGTLVSWHYVEAKVAEERIEAIDRENKSMTWEVIGGDLLEHYKSFKFILHVTTQNDDQDSSMVHWILEYEKVHDSVPDPHDLLQLIVSERICCPRKPVPNMSLSNQRDICPPFNSSNPIK